MSAATPIISKEKEKYSINFQKGLEFQDFVINTCFKAGIIICQYSSKKYQYEVGESNGYEIKLDNRCTDTNRLSIEIAEKTSASNTTWIRSGIFRQDNTLFYIIGNYNVFFLFAKKHLQNYCLESKPLIDTKFGTIKTFYLDFDCANKLSIKRFDCSQ